ncbi:hypothetical protein GCM10009853_015360 [Glycomyces scopariae]
MQRIRSRLAAIGLALATAITLVFTQSVAASPASSPLDAPSGIGAQQSCQSVSGGPESNPNVTGRQTVRSIASYRGTIQVRSGYLNGVRYGWARVIDGNPVWGIVMKIDLNGDRVEDLACEHDGFYTGTSYMYPTSTSSNRAFKACILITTNTDTPCTPQYQTAWW